MANGPRSHLCNIGPLGSMPCSKLKYHEGECNWYFAPMEPEHRRELMGRDARVWKATGVLLR